MDRPRVPGSSGDQLELPCGESIPPDRLDMGMRELECVCGDRHAVVMDVHPLGRWIPESVAGILDETIEPTDEHDAFGTIHLMGMVLEEYPDRVTVHNGTEDPAVGWAMAWITAFDATELHELVVELLLELMDHAVGHAQDERIQTEFTEQIQAFDIEEFVTTYREQRDFDERGDEAL